MKSILSVLLVMFSCFACFSQESVERTKQLSQVEKAKFTANESNKALSLASNNFTVSYYRCRWTIDPAVRYISGSVTSYFKTTALTNKITYDLTNILKVDSVLYHNQKTTFSQQTNATITITFPVEFWC